MAWKNPLSGCREWDINQGLITHRRHLVPHKTAARCRNVLNFLVVFGFLYDFITTNLLC